MMLLLQGLFRLVLSLSLAGGFATLLVMGARVLARDRLGPRWDRYGWMLPLALYLVPVILPRSAPAQQGAAVQAAGDTAGSVSAAVGGQAPAMASLWEGLMAFWGQVLPVLAWVWLLGMAFAAALRLADSHRVAASLEKCCCPPSEEGRAWKQFQRLLAETDIPAGRVELTICPGIESPLLIGLLRPRVVLPQEDYPDPRLEMMLRHELGHYRSHDLWYKALALGVACLHWFNPLAWRLVRELDRGCELWCDYRATSGMTPRQRRQYGRMLLDVAQGGSLPAAGTAPLAMGKEELKRRLAQLTREKPSTLLERVATLAAAMAVTVAGVALAGAVGPQVVIFQQPDDTPVIVADGGGSVPELWTEGGEPPQAIPQPDPSQPLAQGPIQQRVVLSDQAETSQPSVPAEEETPAEPEPEPDPEPEPASETETEPEPEPETEPEPEPDPNPVSKREDFQYQLTDEEEDSLRWDGSFIWPLDGGYINFGFGEYYGHTGTDIMANAGTEIYAAADGIVSYASGYSIWPYGKQVDIQHGDGMVTRYTHCSQVLVQPGETVTRGQLIALVGRTGNATGNHGHFEVRQDGVPVDAEDYIGSSCPKDTDDATS